MSQMRTVKPVTVSTGGFNACKYSVAVLLWAAVALPTYRISLVGVATLVLALSAMLGVEHAPMIKLFDWTVGHLVKTKGIMLDRRGMRFAHTLGALLCGMTFVLLMYWQRPAFILLVVVALLKTISAIGYCSGLKLYQCMGSDTCCQTAKTIMKGYKG